MGRSRRGASLALPGARVRFRRDRRFDDLVGRQLDLFAADQAVLLAEAEAAEQAWTAAGRDTAEEAYGDYQLVVDALADRLLDIRETYAFGLDPGTDERYSAAFTRAAGSRFARYASLLADLDEV